MKTTLQKSIQQGINLRGTIHQDKSAMELRKSDPAFAARWAKFIQKNKAQLVREITQALDFIWK